MKRKATSLLFVFSLVLSLIEMFPCISVQARETEQSQKNIEQKNIEQKNIEQKEGNNSKEEKSQNNYSQQKVYVCYGPKAYAYHNNRQCRGLNRCSSCIKSIPLNEAKKEKRKPCGYCYGK